MKAITLDGPGEAPSFFYLIPGHDTPTTSYSYHYMRGESVWRLLEHHSDAGLLKPPAVSVFYVQDEMARR